MAKCVKPGLLNLLVFTGRGKGPRGRAVQVDMIKTRVESAYDFSA